MNAPIAWLRVSRIGKLFTGVFETQDVELRSEYLLPLFTQEDKDNAIQACKNNASECTIKNDEYLGGHYVQSKV